MPRKLYILGKSNYALAIIFDMLKLLGDNRDIIVVRNILEKDNSSSSFDYNNGTIHSVIDLDEFSPSAKDEFIIGSIGRSRKRIKKYFEKEFSMIRNNM